MIFILKISLHILITLLPLLSLMVGVSSNILNITVWVPIFVVFVCIPCLDKILLSMKISSSSLSYRDTNVQDSLYAVLTVFVQIVIYMGSMFAITIVEMSLPTLIAFLVSVFASTIINCGPPAHKLIHGKSKLERICGTILLDLIIFPSYRIEHFYSHHINANTPKDIFHSNVNDSIYLIVGRSFKFNTIGVWKLQNRERRHQKKSFLSSYNYLLANYTFCLCLLTTSFFLFGLIGVSIYLGISLLTILAIFSLSYVEHYGLTNTNNSLGWSYCGLVSNILFSNHQLHNQHHNSPSTHHSKLKIKDSDLQYPLNYTAMFVIALVPPVWFRVVNPIIDMYKTSRS